MYYQNYEDYMRQVLGYPINDPNIYERYNYENNKKYQDTYYLNRYSENYLRDEILSYYPEIYHKIYPLVCKACDSYTQPINIEAIEKMTDEIYNAIENSNQDITNSREELHKNEKKLDRNENIRKENIHTTQRRDFNRNEKEQKENIQNTQKRQVNFLLRDLIKILILNRLLNRNKQNYSRISMPVFSEEFIEPQF